MTRVNVTEWFLRVGFVAAALGAIALWPARSGAGQADVVSAALERLPDGRYVVIATVRHADEDFEHFADRFEVIAPDGTVLATRPLAHPHVDEQPFTRALVGAVIPDEVRQVTVRAHDKRHGLGGKSVVLEIPAR